MSEQENEWEGVNERFREWDMDMANQAIDEGWLTEDEGETLKELLNKIWDGRQEARER